jgi:hypothetical protein
MPLSKFVQFSADAIEEIDEMGESRLPEVRKLYLQFLTDLDVRLSEQGRIILDWFIDDGYEKAVEETGNEDLAAAQWEQISLMLEMGWDELYAPDMVKGELWRTATGIISAAGIRYAFIMSGVAQQSIAKGVELGNELKTATKGLGRLVLESATYHVQTELKKRKNARTES